MNKQTLKDFEVFLSFEKRCSPVTIRQHLYRLKKLYHWLGQRDLTYPIIQWFLLELRKKNQAPATICGYIFTIRHWSEFSVTRGLMKESFGSQIKLPRIEEKLPDVLTAEELRLLVEAGNNLPRQKLAFKTDTAIILLIESGARVSEITNLKVKDLNFTDRLITIQKTKTKIPRLIPFSTKVNRRLKILVKNKSPEEFVFEGRDNNGKPLNRMTIWGTLKKRARKVGIKKRVYPHLIRHSAATNWIRQNFSLPRVQKVLGHKRIATTERYTHMVADDIRELILSNNLMRGIH